MGDAGRLDGPDLLELYLPVSEIAEGTSTAAEQHRNDMELEFVKQPRCEVLLDDVAAAPEHALRRPSVLLGITPRGAGFGPLCGALVLG